MKLQRKPQERAFTGRLVGRPYDGPTPSPKVIDGGVVQYFENDATPPPKKMGRPPKGAVAMTPAERKQRQRSKAAVDAMLAALTLEQAADRKTGGYGKGWFIKDADTGKGEIRTGGYGSKEVDAMDARHNPGWDGEKSTFTLPSKPSGAGADDEMKFGEQFFRGKYTATFNHSWDLRSEEIKWDRPNWNGKTILGSMMVDTTVCLLCDWHGNNFIATAGEIHEHEKTHDTEVEVVIQNEPRCIVCCQPGTEHIRECELTTEDRKHNKTCNTDLEIFKHWGPQPRKMADLDKEHRRVVRAVRKAMRTQFRTVVPEASEVLS
jgi:hypothetical protein